MGKKENESLIINYSSGIITTYAQLSILKHKKKYFVIEAYSTMRRVIKKKISLRTIKKALEYRNVDLDRNNLSSIYYYSTDFHIFVFNNSDLFFEEFTVFGSKKEVIREWVNKEIRRQEENEPTSY